MKRHEQAMMSRKREILGSYRASKRPAEFLVVTLLVP